MFYSHFRILLVCAVGLTVSGCATPALLKYASKEEVRDHRIAEVVSAYRADGGVIVMCTTGWPAMRSRDIAPAAFSISFPVSLFENAPATPPALDDDAGSIASYRLAPGRMGEACPKDPADAEAIPVRPVGREYFGGEPAAMASVDVIAPFLDEQDPGALVYVLGVGDHTRSPLVVYQHTGPIFRGSRLVAIAMPSETVKPNQTAYLVLPLAFMADVALGAVIVVAYVLVGMASAG